MHLSLTILFRLIHTAAACLAIGGFFFMRLIFPAGLTRLEEPYRTDVFLRVRRRFKMLIHTCILLLVVSGIYNSMGNWAAYHTIKPTSDILWGTHVLLALLIFAIALGLLAPKEPPKRHRLWALVNLLLMFSTLAVAAGLKYARDNRPQPTAPPGLPRLSLRQ